MMAARKAIQPDPDPDTTLGGLRRTLLWILLFGCAGVEVELLLLAHYEDTWQLVPLVGLGLALLATGWQLAANGAASRFVFRRVMGALLVSGALGIWFHYQGNVEFERERDPSIAGWRLFADAMTGATPALAPGTFFLLGVIGLAAVHGLTTHNRSKAGPQ